MRAKATFARLERCRLANSIPQRLSFENCVIRDRLPCVVPPYRPFGGKSGAIAFTESLRRDTPKMPGLHFALRAV